MEKDLRDMQPLAERIRPGQLQDFVGQEQVQERLQALAQAQSPSSVLFFGPPGSGKSTLALILARSYGQEFLRLSAPETGLADLRKQLAETRVLILDEIHRFSKAQQDFFLPLLENGALVLLATTTENPSFNLTNQLLSRMHILRLRALSSKELGSVLERGLQTMDMQLSQESKHLLIAASRGDARVLLNLLEYVQKLPQEKRQAKELTQALPEIMQQGDKDGDSHYELASALIKSLRGSDPDAALYYLAGMLEGGEDPRFICRRLILAASEDVGLADPQALPLAVSCAQAVEMVGMPEGFIPLAETVTYLALAPKSNSSYAAYLSAQKEIRNHGLKPVPLHLRNAVTAMQKKWGYGQGYKYPHAYPGAWIEQEYLPEGLVNSKFYQPKDQGQEQRLNLWLRNRQRRQSKK
ncbi:MAG: replication-associated recombination protein A [Desulfohalobiaceae bacterium]